jgi:mono/diheme cytochrome c family protein
MKPIRKILDFNGATAAVLAAICVYAAGLKSVEAQPPPFPRGPTNVSKVLAWDADLKELTTKPGDSVAKFTFSVTNVTDYEVVITDAKPSCGCTEAKMPSKPWHLAGHSNGVIDVGVNLAGKSGTIYKWVDVFYASNAQKRLNLKVIMPEDANMVRNRNQQMARADRQAVFKGDCAKCHVPAQGKMGKDLYVAACGVCHDEHEGAPRATAVPDLHAMNHATDLTFWKVWISGGKPGTMMPAFSKAEGGPLTDEQIDSLAQVMLRSFPPMRPAPVKAASLGSGTTATAAPQKN